MDYTVYNSQMFKSAYDKLGFVDKVFDVDLVIDFGCADGAITQLIKMFMPEAKVIGYDKFQMGQNKPGVGFCHDFETLKVFVENAKRPLLVMNSVVHEVLNYEEEPLKFLEELFNLKFAYIWIRDLYLSPFYASTNHEIIKRIHEKYPNQAYDFCQKYGSFHVPYNLIHFLMKYRYQKNWEHELEEDYTLFEKSIFKITDMLYDNYENIVSKEYVLPYTRKVIRDDFEFDIKRICYTHFKSLWERR